MAPTGGSSPAFVVELLHWLRDQPHSAAAFAQALHRALDAQDDSADEMLRLEHQREAADQLAIGNVITSMRLVSSIDWTVFFERTSLVEQVLREDPSGAYPLMDFPTRDRYRHAVEGLAKRARHAGDWTVARAAVAQAAAAARDDPGHDRRHHVGYYLISRGRFELERQIGYAPTVARTVRPVLLRPSGARLPRHDRRHRPRSAMASLLAYADAPRRLDGDAGRWSRWSRCCRSASW